MDNIKNDYPYFSSLFKAFEETWPEHNSFLEKGIMSADDNIIAHANRLAELFHPIMKDEMNALVKDYQWMCKMLLDEQMHF